MTMTLPFLASKVRMPRGMFVALLAASVAPAGFTFVSLAPLVVGADRLEQPRALVRRRRDEAGHRVQPEGAAPPRRLQDGLHAAKELGGRR